MTETNRTLLILHLDETLLFSSEKKLDREPEFLVGPYFVYRRPHLNEFLSAVEPLFDLAVWSSSSPDYAVSIVSTVLPAGLHLKFVWGRERCVQRFDREQQTAYYVKDLKKVERQEYDLNRILIADDTPQKCERNYGNAIYVRPFFGDPNDTELEQLARYLKSLASFKNVRSIEKRNWRIHYEAGGSPTQTGFFERD